MTPAEYTGALGVMCKCVASIGFKKRKAGDEDYKLNFAEQGMQVWFEGFECFIVHQSNIGLALSSDPKYFVSGQITCTCKDVHIIYQYYGTHFIAVCLLII